jgi:hypothetical protein
MKVNGELHSPAALPLGKELRSTYLGSPRTGLDRVKKRRVFDPEYLF